MRPRGFRDPARSIRVQAARDRGVGLELAGARLERIERGGSWWAWPVAAQRWGSAFVASRGGDPEANATVRGACAASSSAIAPAFPTRAWRAAGIYHVLCVSGLHLAVVAGLAFALLRRLVAASPWGGRTRPARRSPRARDRLHARHRRAARDAARAGRRADHARGRCSTPARLVDALGVAAIAILAWRPADLFDPSFQLSFVAALTLALLPRARPASRLDAIACAGSSAASRRRRGSRSRPRRSPRSTFIRSRPAASIGNLVLTPLVELVALPLGARRRSCSALSARRCVAARRRGSSHVVDDARRAARARHARSARSRSRSPLVDDRARRARRSWLAARARPPRASSRSRGSRCVATVGARRARRRRQARCA